MCNFISWIEKDGQLLYLTDEDIFSSYGRDVLNGCQDNDCLGHGAIRRYFGVYEEDMFGKNEEDLIGGEEYEVKNFWELELLPKEIANKVKEFNKHWRKTFSRCFMNNDLCYIIKYATEEWKELAWKQLMKQNPGNFDLCYIVYNNIEKYKDLASEQLLKQNPDNNDLSFIIKYSIEKYKDLAWKQLMKQNPNNNDLSFIIKYSIEKYKDLASEQLLKHSPNSNNLCYIIEHSTEKWKEKALFLIQKCPACGGKLYRKVRENEVEYKGQKMIYDQPGWYCDTENCEEAIYSPEDMKSWNLAISSLKTRVD